MADVFVSYARTERSLVAPLVAAIESAGYSVWWDSEIHAGQQFDDRIEAELNAARAVVVVWTPTSVASRWVRGEARDALERGVLVPVRFDEARLPVDVRALHTIDLDDWNQDRNHAAFLDLTRALGGVMTRSSPEGAPTSAAASPKSAMHAPDRVAICVLPFINMSGDPDQEYFSDGITEDVITDLSKVSALSVTSRNSAFAYKSKHVDIPKVVRELGVSHVLEGSVRKAGGRVRITAQLINGASNDHLWAERYDRDLNDIFALQDEISEAIVTALKLRLMPEEKKAIEQRGTEHVEAYNLYLMARQAYVLGNEHNDRSAQAIVRLCQRAIEFDPSYARAWALLAVGQRKLRSATNIQSDGGLAAAERALALDPEAADARAVRGEIWFDNGLIAAANDEIAAALALAPESYETNRAAGLLFYRQQRLAEAARHLEQASTLNETDIWATAMCISCYAALGDTAGTRRVAQVALARAEKALEREPNHGPNTAYSAYALAALGQADRARVRMQRAILIEPDNMSMRYNFASASAVFLHDYEGAIDLLEPVLAGSPPAALKYLTIDPDFEALRGNPRFDALVAAAHARHAQEAEARGVASPGTGR